MDNFFYYIFRMMWFVVSVCVLVMFTPIGDLLAVVFRMPAQILADAGAGTGANPVDTILSMFNAIGNLIVALGRGAGKFVLPALFAAIFMKIMRMYRMSIRRDQLQRRVLHTIREKPVPAPELVDPMTWLYRQSTLIAEGAITREGENRAVKEYQAMIKAENTWRAENGLELVEDVTAKPNPARHIDPIVIRSESGKHAPECPCSKCDWKHDQCT